MRSKRRKKKLILPTNKTRNYILMNAVTFNNTPWENAVPQELLPYSCDRQRCHCNARFERNVHYVKGSSYQSNPPPTPDNNFTIQFIEFIYSNDGFSQETIDNKI